MGRLWHSLILSKWKSVFAYLPIETWIKLNQREYYKALEDSDNGDLTPFIKFMLSITQTAVDEFIDEAVIDPKALSNREIDIMNIISDDENLTSAKMAEILGISERTVKRYIASLVQKGILIREGSDKTGHWKIIR